MLARRFVQCCPIGPDGGIPAPGTTHCVRAYLWRRAEGWWLLNLSDTTLILDDRTVPRGGRARVLPRANLHVQRTGHFVLHLSDDGSLVVEKVPNHRAPRVEIIELDPSDLLSLPA